MSRVKTYTINTGTSFNFTKLINYFISIYITWQNFTYYYKYIITI